MISVLICSLNPKLLSDVKENVAKTIGCKYEILYYNNSIKPKSIFWVYNNLKKIAKGSVLCFLHEDVAFNTNNWGMELLRIFDNTEIGLVGVAGSTYKSTIPSSWDFNEQCYFVNIIQNNKERNHSVHTIFGYNDIQVKNEEPVVTVDGVLMAISADINKKVSFNQKLSGFHAYDSDLSLAVIAQNKKVVVTNSILIEHFSKGSPNREWLQNHIKNNSYWKAILPLKVLNGQYIQQKDYNHDFLIDRIFKQNLINFGFSKVQVYLYSKQIFDFKDLILFVMSKIKRKNE